MKVLITAGPTYEPIDPVRFIGNRSTGKMGIAIAEEFAENGNEVTLIKGATDLTAKNNSIKQINVQTAAEMFDACVQYFALADVIVFAAAVADYTPKFPNVTKIKKKQNELTIELTKTKDILQTLGQQKNGQILVGFALETTGEKAYALDKLHKKNADLIVLNSLNDAGAGFGYDTNKVTIFDKSGGESVYAQKTKQQVAADIVDKVVNMLYA